jgi:DNA-binding CsgD family transcriptional regulator
VFSDPARLLSERELAVLALLPSLLSAGEIADEFTVSANTVKSHIQSIYAKLGVSSRLVTTGRGRRCPRARASPVTYSCARGEASIHWRADDEGGRIDTHGTRDGVRRCRIDGTKSA